jgi:hypothetical protein
LNFSLPVVWTCTALVSCISLDVQGVCLSTASSIDVQGVSPSTASSIDVQGVSPSTASSMNVQGAPFFEMPEWRTVRHPVSPAPE